MLFKPDSINTLYGSSIQAYLSWQAWLFQVNLGSMGPDRDKTLGNSCWLCVISSIKRQMARVFTLFLYSVTLSKNSHFYVGQLTLG